MSRGSCRARFAQEKSLEVGFRTDGKPEVIVGLVLLRGFVRGVRARSYNFSLVETRDGLLFFRSGFRVKFFAQPTRSGHVPSHTLESPFMPGTRNTAAE